MPTTMRLDIPPRFSLPHAVCSYGFFILAPNFWAGHRLLKRGELHRPLRLRDETIVQSVIRQVDRQLVVTLDGRLPKAELEGLSRQVRRMLRLDEDFRGWRKAHPTAARARFEVIYRSPTLFEDIVKTMTSCNVTWPGTVHMNRMLVEHVGRGDFPTARELARWEPGKLAEVCRVGYRAERMIRLARDVAEGRLDLAALEAPERSTEEVREALLAIHGIGPYAAANVLQLLGRYDLLPVDSETIRHFRQFHGAKGDVRRLTKLAHRHYERFAPYQFLAYWFELWGDYQSRFGRSHQWPERVHRQFTAAKLK